MSGSQACGDEISQRRVSVCVATCGRPIGLANLLGALEVLEMPPGTTLQIVVVDNDSSESARAVCDEAAARHAYSLRYMVEKRRGIPFARNAALAVALSDSDFVAFIDDDETPESDWLAELLRVQEYYNADVVTGPCLPRYVEPPPSWVVDGAFHETPRHPTGTLRHVAFTHNALVRAAVFEIVDRYFDESMALNGGDDAEFFTRVFTAGFAWVELSHHSSTLPRQLVHSVYCMVKGTGIALLLPLRGRAAGAKGLQLFSYGLGRIAGSSGYLHQEYRVVHGT